MVSNGIGCEMVGITKILPPTGLFGTKQTLPKDAGRESIIKTTLRELLVYLTFLSVVSVSK